MQMERVTSVLFKVPDMWVKMKKKRIINVRDRTIAISWVNGSWKSKQGPFKRVTVFPIF
jgi:hypothetical protein